VTAQITTWITGPASRVLVLNALAAILLDEFAGQEALAIAASEDPAPYQIRVFARCLNAVSHWIDAPDSGTDDARPIVNISFDRQDYERAKSNIVKQRSGPARFYLDCFGYAKSKRSQAGHDPGDVRADETADWVAYLIEQIVMSGHYAYLGMRTTVGRRFIESVERMRVGTEEHPVQNIAAWRITLSVELNEESPQVQGEIIEAIDVAVHRLDNDQLILEQTIALT
jgi:hypothetical protein